MAKEIDGHILKVSIDQIDHKEPQSWQGKTIYNIGIKIEGEWHNTAVFKDWDLLKMKETLILDKNIELFFFMQEARDGNGKHKKFRLVTKFDLLDRKVDQQAKNISLLKEQVSALIDYCYDENDEDKISNDHRPFPTVEETEKNISDATTPTVVDETDDLPF